MRRDPVRPGRRLEIEIEVLPLEQVIPGQDQPVPHGVQRVVIHESDLPTVEALVEHDLDSLAAATAKYERKLRAHLQREFTEAGSAPIEIPEDRRNWSDAMRRAEYRYTATSPMAEFVNETGHDLKALGYVKVIGEAAPEISREAMLAADAVRYAGGYAQPSGLTEVLERLERLEAENASLRAALGEPTPKRQKT